MGNGLVMPENMKEPASKALTEQYEALVAAGVTGEELQAKLSALHSSLVAESFNNENTVLNDEPQNHEKNSNIATDKPHSNPNHINSENINESKKISSIVNPSPRVTRSYSLRVDSLSPKPTSKVNSPHIPAGESIEKKIPSTTATPTGVGSKAGVPRVSMRQSILTSPHAMFVRNKSFIDPSRIHKLKESTPHSSNADNQADHHVSKEANPAQLSPTSSEPTTNTPKDIDNWDSVTKQPFCPVCQMAFKSLAFLDRHVKYSEIHQKTIEELKQLAKEQGVEFVMPTINLLGTSNGISPSNDGNQTKTPTTSRVSFRGVPKAQIPIDGIDYRLIYTGAKYYWRTQENIDMDIYFHIKHRVIEVVPYDSAKGKEFNRLYFGSDNIHKLVDPDVEEKVDKQIKDLSNDRFATIPPRQTLILETQQHAIVTYLLSKLQKNGEDISFVSTTLASEETPLLQAPPGALIPVPVLKKKPTDETPKIETLATPLNQPPSPFAVNIGTQAF